MSILDKIKYYANKTWVMMLDFKDWHQDVTNDFAHQYDITPWGIGIIGFGKGMLVVLLLQWIF